MNLDIVASGMVTPVGYQAASSCAALRCGIDNFKRTRFEFDGELLRAGVVEFDGLAGLEKQATMAVSAIEECLKASYPIEPKDTALAVCLAEEERPGRQAGLDAAFAQSLVGRLKTPSRIGAFAAFQTGSLGGLEALLWAESLFRDSTLSHFIVVGVDSYLTAGTLRHLHAQKRLLTKTNTDGFIPGEAAAAILVSRTSRASVAIECRGIGWGREKAVRGSGLPLRGDGLARAYKAAFQSAGYGFPEVHYRIADVGGDHYAFKEAALALLRTMRVRKEDFYLWHPADCVGRVGAASVPLVVGVALAAARRSYSPGPGALCHFADEGGIRAALVLRERDTRAASSRTPFPMVQG